MLKKHLILILFISNYLYLVCMEDNITFKTQIIESNCLSEDIKINLRNDNQTIGFVYYTSLLFKIYIVHSYFVFPKFRNQGYGKKLLSYALSVLKDEGARLIFIQPGPFEIKNNRFENLPRGSEREVSIKKLVKLYKSKGFNLAPKIISWGACPIYKLAGIDEDSQYLMIKK